MTRRYIIAAYDMRSEMLVDQTRIEPRFEARIKHIAGIRAIDEAIGDYPLDVDQANRIANILGITISPNTRNYYLEPYEPT